jgi:hypothetical protein
VDATGGSGRGLAVGAADGVAEATTDEVGVAAENVGDAEGDPAGPRDTAHAESSTAIAHGAAALTTPLARTPRRAREAGRARARSA